MHSSRMRTIHCTGSLGGRGCLPRGVYTPLWTEFLTHACENIPFLQLLLRTVKITNNIGLKFTEFSSILYDFFTLFKSVQNFLASYTGKCLSIFQLLQSEWEPCCSLHNKVILPLQDHQSFSKIFAIEKG